MRTPIPVRALLLASIFALVGCEDEGVTVGQLSHGGIVGYILEQGDPGYDPNVQHGLIAAPYDQSTGICWNNGSFTATGAVDKALGAGEANTALIVGIQGEGAYAAKLCNDLELGGYDDWYLPSEHEMGRLSLNEVAIGGFDYDACYWSSTELDDHHAWVECIDGRIASPGYYDNTDQQYVRCVRTF